MDKSNGRVLVLNGRVFYSPNCSRIVDHPSPIRDNSGMELNHFLPNRQPNGRYNYFD